MEVPEGDSQFEILYERAFHGQFGPVPVEVRECSEPGRGQGVFARRGIEKNEVIFIEKPLAVAPEVFSTPEVRNAPELLYCWQCMASHTPNPFGDQVPFADARWPKFFPVGCDYDDNDANSAHEAASGSCDRRGKQAMNHTIRFCNKFCRENAFKQGYGRMVGKSAEFSALVQHIDKELPEAWDPMRHAILLVVRLLAHILHEREQMSRTEEHHAWRVCNGLVGSETNRVSFWQPTKLYALVGDFLGMNDEEKHFFNEQDLSALIGKAFCNTMEVRPKSTFSQYMSNSRSDRRKLDNSLQHLLDLAEALQREGPPLQEGWEDIGEDAKSDTVMLKASELDGFFSRLTGCGAAGLYSLHSKINHSCNPNVCVVSGSFTDSSIEVVALRDIKRDEEVCFSYTDPRLSKAQRRRILQNNHFFLCNCQSCVDPQDKNCEVIDSLSTSMSAKSKDATTASTPAPAA